VELPSDLIAQALPPANAANVSDTSCGPALGDDLLWGVNAIAREINRTNRQTFHMLENTLLPARKVGARWCAQAALG
jgi:hypothetical protein